MSEYIKFTCERVAGEITSRLRRGYGEQALRWLAELNAYRGKLLNLRLIGVDPNGIGFGNLSVRDVAADKFYITGSGTGDKRELTLADCAKIVAYDFERNWVQYKGCAIPSSESLTHAAIYKSNATAGAIIHCHNSKLWEALLNHAPTSSKAAEYGTPEMADEIMRLFMHADAQSRKIVIMAGHEGGVVTFGKDLEEAFAVLMREREKI